MPHLVIEYSDNLRPFPHAQVMTEVNASCCQSPAILDEADFKTRIVARPHFEIGIAPNQRAFVHATLRLLSGRSPEAKRDLSERIAAVLRKHTPRPEGVSVQLSVELVDMDRDSFVKEKL